MNKTLRLHSVGRQRRLREGFYESVVQCNNRLRQFYIWKTFIAKVMALGIEQFIYIILLTGVGTVLAVEAMFGLWYSVSIRLTSHTE